MSDCPPIEELERLLARDDRKTIKHAETCTACQGVLALLLDHDEHSDDPGAPACAAIEILLAKRLATSLAPDEETSLSAHLETCPPCRQLVADTTS